MDLFVEDFVPYDRSAQWRIHDAYFERRGVAAWRHGDIPYEATSNLGAARQQARMVIALVEAMEACGDLAPDDPVWVLEVGSGLGLFAANFLRALDDDGCGAAGRRLAGRIRYLLSDYSHRTVREAITSPALAPRLERGQVVPALFDLRDPAQLTDLDGRPLDMPLVSVLANYVCCVAPAKIVRKVEGRFDELYLRLRVPLETVGNVLDSAALVEHLIERADGAPLLKSLQQERDWREVHLPSLFTDEPRLAEVVQTTLAPFATGTVVFPYGFFRLLFALHFRMRRGGAVLVSDYGNAQRAALSGLLEPRANHYGNSLAHGVNFSLFDAFAKVAGLSVLRTDDPFRALHAAAIVFAPAPPGSVRTAFERFCRERQDGEDLLDFLGAGRSLLAADEPVRAARLLARCLRLDPDHPEVLFRLGQACVDAEYLEQAVEHLQHGRDLDTAGQWDFDFQLGRALVRLRRLGEAREAYQRSLAHEPDAATWTNIGCIDEEEGHLREAYRCYTRALELKPDYERARRLRDELRERWLNETLAGEGPIRSVDRN